MRALRSHLSSFGSFKNNLGWRSAFFAVLLASGLLATTPAQAAIISIESNTSNSTEGLGFYTGTLEYLPATGKLKISLTNTTPLATGGRLVALAFNNPGGITGASFTTDTLFDNLLGGPTFSGGVSVSPFGDWDIGASITSSWLGGGSPNDGIPVGGTGNFEFTFTGAGLNLLTTQSFVDALDHDEFFLVRFRGIPVGAGSDKVPAQVVPELPANLLLLSVCGIIGCLGLLRRSLFAR